MSKFNLTCPICKTPYRYTGENMTSTETQFDFMIPHFIEMQGMLKKHAELKLLLYQAIRTRAQLLNEDWIERAKNILTGEKDEESV